MTWIRANSWLVAGVLAVLLAATAGYALGSGAANSKSDAVSALEEGYETAYDSSFARVRSFSRNRGLAAGRERGELAGDKTGAREGFDLGSGDAGVRAVKADGEAAEAAKFAAEAELAERRSNCGSIPGAPKICPTSAELADYQAALEAARKPGKKKPGRRPKNRDG